MPTRRHLLVLAAAMALLLSLAGSALKSTVQVYFGPMAESMQASIGVFAWSTTMFAVTIAVASPLVGILADRYGGPVTLTIGAVTAGITFITCAAAPSVVLFAISYGLLGAFAYTMLSFVPLGVLVDQIFAGRNAGLTYAALTNGPAIGFMVLVPLWIWVQDIGWRPVFTMIGIVFLVLLTPIAASLRRFTATDGGSSAAPPAAPLGVRLKSLLTSRVFVVLGAAFFGCGTTMAFVDVHFVASMNLHGVRPGSTSFALALLGAFEILGSLLAGRLCDKGMIKRTLVGGYLVRGSAMFVLAAAPTGRGALTFGVVFGTSYLMTVIATTMWLLRGLPDGMRGTGIGALWTVHSIGAAFGSQAGALLAESAGGYGLVSAAGGGFVLLSAALVTTLPSPSAPEEPALPTGPPEEHTDTVEA